MNQNAASLMEVLQPPGTGWLKSLSRRGATLPVGVYVVRFGSEEDDPADDGVDAESIVSATVSSPEFTATGSGDGGD